MPAATRRGPRARGTLRAAAVVVAVSPIVPPPVAQSARRGGTRSAAPAAAARAVSTRDVAPGRAGTATPKGPPRVASGAYGGWVRVESPVEMDLSIDGTLVGTTAQALPLLAAGPHEIVVSSRRAGFRTTERVTVEPGQVSTVAVAVPDGSLTVEATPDADVFVDGKPLGATPLRGIPISAGVRHVVVRSASLGERTYEVVVREGQHTALSVDLRPR